MRTREAAAFLSCVLFACADGGDPPETAGTRSNGRQCSLDSATGIQVADEDLNGYPPYALMGCTLTYVSREGALVFRDLGTDEEMVVAPPADRPRRPAADGELLAWEALEQGRNVVRVRKGSEVRTVQGSFYLAGEPRVSGRTVVFTAWVGAEDGDSDVWLYEWDRNSAEPVLAGQAQQRFADVSADFVVATDFSEEGPTGRFDGNDTDLADLIVYARATKVVTRRPAPGKQAFPMLAAGQMLAYLDWNLVHPEPKLSLYDLRAGTVLGDYGSDRALVRVQNETLDYARPAVSGAVVEWISWDGDRTALERIDLANPSSVPVRALLAESGVSLHAPAPSQLPDGVGVTLVAASDVNAESLGARLRTVLR